MSATLLLSRPGRCAGRVPLSSLIQKLIRSGEHLAARALQSLPECRVRWTLYGTALFLEADGSHAACGVLSEQGGRGRACLAAHPSRRREWSKEVA